MLDVVGPRVDSQSGLGVLLPVHQRLTLVFLHSLHVNVSHGLIVCDVFGDLFHELVVVLGLEVLSVGGKDELGIRLNLGLLGGLSHQLVLGVQGAGEGSGASFLLLQVKLLVLSSVRVHLHTNPLGLGADVLGAGSDCAPVEECRRQRTASGCRTPQIWCL